MAAKTYAPGDSFKYKCTECGNEFTQTIGTDKPFTSYCPACTANFKEHILYPKFLKRYNGNSWEDVPQNFLDDLSCFAQSHEAQTMTIEALSVTIEYLYKLFNSDEKDLYKTLLKLYENAEHDTVTENALKITSQAIITNFKGDFSTIRQGTSTNALTKLRAVEGKDLNIDSVTGDATIKNGNFTLTIPNYEQLAGLKTSTYQLLDAITIALTESGAKSPTVVLSVDDYMKRRELKDRKEARKQLTADLDVLLKTSLTWEEKRGKNSVPYAGVNITDSWIWVDGKKTAIAYTFGQTFFNVLLGYPIMAYPAQLQTINNKRNPNSYYLLRKISEHKNMNVGKGNEDTIAVATLLSVAPLPSYEEVMAGNRNIAARIITPFERDMDALSDTLSWEYCHKNGEPLTDAELNSFNYELFISLNIKTKWNKYPDQTARLERKKERIAQAKKKAATKKKKTAAE